jgi:hypothetical protein
LLVTAARFLRIARQRLRAIARPRRLDAELEQELALHFDQLVRENIAGGMAPPEARQAARRSLGNAAALADRCRDERRVN